MGSGETKATKLPEPNLTDIKTFEINSTERIDVESDNRKHDLSFNISKNQRNTLRLTSSSVTQSLALQFHPHGNRKVILPHQLFEYIKKIPHPHQSKYSHRIIGSIIGMAIGDALGAPVEFRPYQYMQEHSVKDFQDGGTWGLKKGQFTDDTTMALCLASSLIACQGFSLYNQLVRYKWWYRHGYMSSTGECFDIGTATRNAIIEFETRQEQYSKRHQIEIEKLDYYYEDEIDNKFNFICGARDAAGNGSLMRLAPVPLFFFRDPERAVRYSGSSSLSTHGDQRAVDACRFYGALIVGALNGVSKEELLSPNFVKDRQNWFGKTKLCEEVMNIVNGSYREKKDGHENGICGSGFVINSLEAALWAFDKDGDKFEDGVLKAVNLGDDTDTTAAIYGQLAGAYYGFDKIPERWRGKVYARDFLILIGEFLDGVGLDWYNDKNEEKN